MAAWLLLFCFGGVGVGGVDGGAVAAASVGVRAVACREAVFQATRMFGFLSG
jgi:hypothetical protein